MRGKIKSKYRVRGTFSYIAYCHLFNVICDSSEACEGHENVKTIDVQVQATTTEEASDIALEDYDHDGAEPQWLFGYPSIECLGTVHEGPSIRDYWLRAKS